MGLKPVLRVFRKPLHHIVFAMTWRVDQGFRNTVQGGSKTEIPVYSFVNSKLL